MLDSLGDAFRQAYENFKKELNRDRVPEAVDRLLRAMKDELVDLEAGSRELERELAEVREEAEREDRSARTCVRREELALRIDDQETATVAREYARRHLRRHEILVEKAEVLSRELEQRGAELEDLTGRFEEARRRRASLSATQGRADARDSLRQADDLFAEMDRMAEQIGDLERTGAAAAELDGALGSDAPPREPDAAELEDRLEELKRRMREG